ncbi:SET and MYND domain-containing protein 4 [Dunckerocampus dactyliophorus]|uniref:SET and MYND domain-containing protein 4 n=1 Tax=Dunckerocampus dactyliophorus TaxID=161453 RepID=UPI0024057EC8|nr:SET and MYND domain-containing protein 4 [Dunckerocampus dactyliophorus]
MDLPCVPWQDHVARKWAGLEPEFKEHFKSVREIEDIFKSALSVTTQDDVCCLQSISAGHHGHKDSEAAARCRERGNTSFKSRKYTDATLHYSQGVCFAPRSSEQLSLCYANRSAALYHLHHYQEALDDIEEAKRNSYPSHLLEKLEKRRAQCLTHLSSSDTHRGPQIAERPPSGPLTLGLCPQAAVHFSSKKGRHLVAAKRISAGEVILSERPYSCVLIPSMKGVMGDMLGTECRCCHRCLVQTLSPVPCGGCAYSRYCSDGCRKLAWEEHHRWECPLGEYLMAVGVMSQLALRVVLKAGVKNIRVAMESSRENARPSEYSGHSYMSVFHLLHHLNHQSPSMHFLCAVTIATLCMKLNRTGPPPSSKDLSGPLTGQSDQDADLDVSPEWQLLGSVALRHLLQLRCNGQAVITLQEQGPSDALVQSSQEARIATAIFPTLSLLNHSCRPNTSLVFSTGDTPTDGSGVAVTIRASQSVSPGQEITHCYGPHNSRMATRERRRLLQEQYFFLCECEACMQTEDQIEDTKGQCGGGTSGLLCAECKASLVMKDTGRHFKCPDPSCGYLMPSSEVRQRLQEVQQDLDLAVDLMERQRPSEALVLLERTWRQSDGTLAEAHPLQGEVADAMARAHATMGQWSLAASHMERSTIAIGSQFGEDSVEMARQLFKLAQLHFNGGFRRSALAIIPKAQRLLCLHCGPHCSEVQELQAMEDCLHESSSVLDLNNQ